MHELPNDGRNGVCAVIPRQGNKPMERFSSVRAQVANSFQRELETLVADVVAAQMETIAEAILQRVLAEIEAPHEREHGSLVEDRDPIETLPMPARVRNAMRRLGIHTIAQLTALREEDLLAVRSLGEQSIRQMTRILALYGLRLAP